MLSSSPPPIWRNLLNLLFLVSLEEGYNWGGCNIIFTISCWNQHRMTAYSVVSSPHSCLLLNYQRVTGKITGISLVWAFNPIPSLRQAQPTFSLVLTPCHLGQCSLVFVTGIFFAKSTQNTPLVQYFMPFQTTALCTQLKAYKIPSHLSFF